MKKLETSYYRLESSADEEGEGDSAHEDGAFFVHVAEGSKARWHHIEDLDAFFTRVYRYHQNNGFGCMLMQQTFELIQFVFVVGFAAFLFRCVNYDLLFKNKSYLNMTEKVTMGDTVYWGGQCSTRIGQSGLLVIFLLIAAIFWGVQVVRVIYNFFRLSEMRDFYSTALRIKPNDLNNMTWHEVQQRLMLVQSEQQMCIHKQDLSELDIYNRILRFKNYMIAMVNKDVLPMRYRVPVLGEVVILTQGLKFNIEVILFWGPFSLFANNYNLKEEYKRRSNREELVTRLEKQMWWAGAINLLFCPIIFVWQLLYSFFNYAEILRREPGSFGARRWSMYSRLYLRHFNELSHEFQARLNRGYSPATKYMGSFNSPFFTIIAKNFAFFTGSLLAVLVALTVWDEDVLRVEHVLTTITLLTVILTTSRSFIPDENAVSCPEQLMKKVLSQIHYVPSSWRGRAHTYPVRDQFAQLFQYKAIYILEELLSPIVTPFILMFPMRHRASRMIDFFRNFTIDIAGVGDVCSFAQMDVRRHGDPKWQVTDEPQPPKQPSLTAEGGKTELSLMHFAITNPKWKPPQSQDKFLSNLKNQAHRDAMMMSRNVAVQNPLLTSLQSLGSIGMPQASFLQQPGLSVMMSTVSPQNPTTSQVPQLQEESLMRESVPPESLTYEESMMTSSFPRQQMAESKKSQKKPRLRGGTLHEGSMEESGLGLISSVVAGQQGLPLNPTETSTAPHQNVCTSVMGGNVFGQSMHGGLTGQDMVELAPVEMGISALYMHELYHNRLVQQDRIANWESIAENNDSGSDHGGDTQNLAHSSSNKQYRSQDRELSTYSAPPNAKQPLLKASPSSAFSQQGATNYSATLSFDGKDSRTMSEPLRKVHPSQHQPFMTLGYEHPTSSRTYSDTAIVQRSQGHRPVENIASHTEEIDIGSDSDMAPQEFHVPEEDTSPPTLDDLPSLGVPPAYDDHHLDTEHSYHPPHL